MLQDEPFDVTSEDFFSQKSTVSNNGKGGEDSRNDCEKDKQLTIFHALGKFLYNKSNHPVLIVQRDQSLDWDCRPDASEGHEGPREAPEAVLSA